MPWATSNRRATLGSDWHKRRAACYRNAGGQCQWVEQDTRCPWVGPLNGTKQNPGGHADHIDRALGEHGPLQWLCPPHHNRKSAHEGVAARPSRHRASPPHPGLK